MCLFTNWPLDPEGKERPKKVADLPRLVDGRLNKKGNYIQGLVWSRQDKEMSCICPPQIPKILYGGLD